MQFPINATELTITHDESLIELFGRRDSTESYMNVRSPFVTTFKIYIAHSPTKKVLQLRIKFNPMVFHVPSNHIVGYSPAFPTEILILLNPRNDDNLNEFLKRFYEKNKNKKGIKLGIAPQNGTIGEFFPTADDFISKIESGPFPFNEIPEDQFVFNCTYGETLVENLSYGGHFEFDIVMSIRYHSSKLFGFNFDTHEFFQRLYNFDKLQGHSLPFIQQPAEDALENIFKQPLSVFFMPDTNIIYSDEIPKYDLKGGVTNIAIFDIPVIKNEIVLTDIFFRCIIEDSNSHDPLFKIKMQGEKKANFYLDFVGEKEAEDIAPNAKNVIGIESTEQSITSNMLMFIKEFYLSKEVHEFKYKFILMVEAPKGTGTPYLSRLTFIGIHGLIETLKNASEKLLDILLESERWFNGKTSIDGDEFLNVDLCHLCGLMSNIYKSNYIRHRDIINNEVYDKFLENYNYFTKKLWDQIMEFERSEKYRFILENIQSNNRLPGLVEAWLYYQSLIFQTAIGARYIEKMREDISSTSQSAIKNNSAWESILSNLPSKGQHTSSATNKLGMPNDLYISVCSNIALTKFTYKIANIPDVMPKKTFDELAKGFTNEKGIQYKVQDLKDLAFVKFSSNIATYLKSSIGLSEASIQMWHGEYMKGTVNIFKNLIDIPKEHLVAVEEKVDDLSKKYLGRSIGNTTTDKILPVAKIGLSVMANGFKIVKYEQDLEDAHERRNYEIEGYLYAAMMFSVVDSTATIMSEVPQPHIKAIGSLIKVVSELSLLYINKQINEEERNAIEILLQSTCFGFYYNNPDRNKYPSIKGNANKQISFAYSILCPIKYSLSTEYQGMGEDVKLILTLNLEFTHGSIDSNVIVFAFFLSDGIMLPNLSRKLRPNAADNIDSIENNIKLLSDVNNIETMTLEFDGPVDIIPESTPEGDVEFVKIRPSFDTIEIIATLPGFSELGLDNPLDVFNQYFVIRKMIDVPQVYHTVLMN